MKSGISESCGSAPDRMIEVFLDYSPIIGSCAKIKEIKSQLKRIAESNTSVLILGESGTGKELVAKAIHELSSRRNQRCVTLNCGAIPPTLVQSELFGYEKGAFTHAFCQKPGRVELANKGTLFLDEIGELPNDQQANLLRFLQEGCFERVGGNEPVHVDVRVVSATNVNLAESVAKGEFREDFYYRINVLTITMPPLRERLEDIELLANHFLRHEIVRYKYQSLRFSTEALAGMLQYSWPGNIRELSNRVRRAVVMCEGNEITKKDLELPQSEHNLATLSLAAARQNAERTAIGRCLTMSNHNISQAARLLKTSRLTLYRLMKKHNIQGLDTEAF
jgi:transcriptional regulator with PAS, ATPase and Fis domain